MITADIVDGALTCLDLEVPLAPIEQSLVFRQGHQLSPTVRLVLSKMEDLIVPPGSV